MPWSMSQRCLFLWVSYKKLVVAIMCLAWETIVEKVKIKVLPNKELSIILTPKCQSPTSIPYCQTHPKYLLHRITLHIHRGGSKIKSNNVNILCLLLSLINKCWYNKAWTRNNIVTHNTLTLTNSSPIHLFVYLDVELIK